MSVGSLLLSFRYKDSKPNCPLSIPVLISNPFKKSYQKYERIITAKKKKKTAVSTTKADKSKAKVIVLDLR